MQPVEQYEAVFDDENVRVKGYENLQVIKPNSKANKALVYKALSLKEYDIDIENKVKLDLSNL